MKWLILGCGALSLLTGCYQATSNGDALRTVPTTNNPNVMPGSMSSTASNF